MQAVLLAYLHVYQPANVWDSTLTDFLGLWWCLCPSMSGEGLLALPAPESDGHGQVMQLDVSTGAPVLLDSQGPLVGKVCAKSRQRLTSLTACTVLPDQAHD